MNEPPQTCPFIDKAITQLIDGQRSIDSLRRELKYSETPKLLDDLPDLGSIADDLEKLRQQNTDLRNWGYY